MNAPTLVAMHADTVTFLQEVARAYDALPAVGFYAPYDALKREIAAQFDVLRAFVHVEFTDRDPYPTSLAMFDAIAIHRFMRVYTVATLPAGHPLAERAPNGETWNSVFRAVHDGLAHYPGRHNFGPLGELRAFQAHCKLLSCQAQWAIATETLGQNAWFNFGPFAHLPIAARPFAPQKFALLPLSLVADAIALEAI